MHVDHEVGPVGVQMCLDLSQHRGRPRLVVDGVEGRDEPEGPGAVQVGDVTYLEVGVIQAPILRLGACNRDRIFREVVADELTDGERPGEQVDRMALAAADVSYS